MPVRFKLFIYILVAYISFAGIVSAQDPLCEALLDAAFKGNYPIVEKILVKDVKPDCFSGDGLTPLLYAIDRGDLKMAELIINSGANVNLNALNDQGETPLILAVSIGNIDAAMLLTDKKANVDAANYFGFSALHYAAYNNDTAIVQLLINRKATIDKKDGLGVTPLMQAAWNGSDDVIQQLIDAGANVNIPDNNGFTPLMYASQNSQYSSAVLLIQNWANVNSLSNMNASPLSLSILEKNTEMVDLLLLNGANPNENYSLSLNPLSLNKMEGNIAIHDTLKKWGGRNNFLPNFGYSHALGLTTRFNDKDFQLGVKMLFRDSKFNMESSVYFSMRPFAIPVLIESGKDSYFQYWERMHVLGLSLGKAFKLSGSIMHQNSIFAEVLCDYSFGRYRGTKIQIDNGIKLRPSLGYENISERFVFRISGYYANRITTGNSHWGIELAIFTNHISRPAKINYRNL